MIHPNVIVWGGFRSHILLPHKVVGSIIDDEPTWHGVQADHQGSAIVYSHNGAPFLRLEREYENFDRRFKVSVSLDPLREVWVQEPGLVLKTKGEGVWRGMLRAHGKRKKWTSQPHTLKNKDAHRSTVHFSRVKTSLKYTNAVRFEQPGLTLDIWGSYGFSQLLDGPAWSVPYTGCEVFGEGYPLAGVYEEPNEVLRRLELAGKPPDVGQFYWFGWTGGPGCVVNDRGRTPPPGMDVTAADGYNKLWNPRSWRRLRPISMVLQAELV